jgi:predicted NACHT family NTPase
MEKVAKPYYLSRSELENEIAEYVDNRLVIAGEPGSGKTTLLHRFVRIQAAEMLNEPKKSRIPVLIPCRDWLVGDAENIIYGSMRKFYPNMSTRAFRFFIRKGKLLCFFDSLDEAFELEERVKAIKSFLTLYPHNGVVISIRDYPIDSFLKLGFHVLEVPPLTDTEVSELLRLRKMEE